MIQAEVKLSNLVDDNGHLLTQLAEFILAQGQTIYAITNPELESGSIGAHVRHIIDHYLSVLSNGPEINYDQRDRDQAMETNASYAADAIYTLIGVLAAITADQPVSVVVSTSVDSDANKVNSTLSRELCFLHSHTTHHMAIIRLLALHNNVMLPSDFGKATSTQKYEKQ